MITKHLRIKHFAFACLLCIGYVAQSQDNDDRLNLPGDNLNLAAVLDIFQQSKTLEAFEQSLNSASSKINNLDLNNDNQIDYLRVVDKVDGTLHSIILQADLAKDDVQDVAIIYVDKSNDQTRIQIIGDEDLYGKDYVIEPSTKSTARETPNPGYSGNDPITNNYTTNNYYNTNQSYSPDPSGWYIVNYLYTPGYMVWNSPWYWGYYPGWWRPWQPMFWHHYHHHCYYDYAWNGWWYRPANNFYFQNHWRNNYYGHHRTSQIVVRNRANGVYNRTYEKADATAAPQGKPNFPTINKRNDAKPVEGRPMKNNDAQDVKPRDNPRDVNNNIEPAPRPRNNDKAEPAPRPRNNNEKAEPAPRQDKKEESKPVVEPKKQTPEVPKVKPESKPRVVPKKAEGKSSRRK